MRGHLRLLALLILALALACGAAQAAGGVKSTDYYNLHYDAWEGVANALTPYLEAAFTTSRDVLGYDNAGYGKIDVYFYSDPRSSTAGYTYAGDNSLHLNIFYGSSTRESYLQDYGQTVAHETAHVFFFHKTNLQSRYAWNTDGGSTWTWITEALSYYVGEVVYPFGPQLSQSTLGSALNYYSRNGSQRSSWFNTGAHYKMGQSSSLELVQLESIGQFLNSKAGWGGFHSLLDSLSSEGNFEAAFKKVYGKETGQFSTDSGASVNTLYSEYLNYYLGHY